MPAPAPTSAPISASTRARWPDLFAAHRDAGGFFNPWGRMPTKGPADIWRWRTSRNPMAADKRVARPPATLRHARAAAETLADDARVTWLGHASVLVELDGMRVLIDPIFGRVAGVIRRLQPAPVPVHGLPDIDTVLLTHGHPDHMDPASLKALSARFGPDLLFITPLGLSRALPKTCRAAVELDWWRQVSLGPLTITLVPAQHWHRRTPFDTNRALWGGAYIAGSRTIYHSGDTGWFEGFAAIGAALGPPDLAVLPMGAYEPRWFMGPQHMAPEQSIEAWNQLGAREMLAMHWGTYDLSDEPSVHGPGVLLPQLLQTAGVDPGRAHVLQPGGALALCDGLSTTVGRWDESPGAAQ